MAFKPSGTEIVSVNCDRTAKLWGQDGALLQHLMDNPARLNAAAFSPNDEWLAIVGR